MSLTRINKKKVYTRPSEAQNDILDALSGDWGADWINGLQVISLGRAKIMQGLFGENVSAIDIPPSESRFAAYFFDANGHCNMQVVEAGAKFVAKPKNITGGFAFLGIV